MIIGESRLVEGLIFTLSYSSNIAAVADKRVLVSGTQLGLNLPDLQAEKIEFFAEKSGQLTVFGETIQVEAPFTLFGRLYRHNSVWKFRLLNETFNGLPAAKQYFGVREFTSPLNEVRQTVVAQTQQVAVQAQQIATQARQESGVEQAVRQGATQAFQGAKKLANGLQQTFVQVMGNSDEIARQQAQNDFKPMDMARMQSVQFPPEMTNLHLGLGWKSKTGAGLLKGFLGGNKSVNVDLDLSAQIFNEKGEVIDTIYFDKIRSNTHAVVHYGDAAQGGNGLQDDEIISIALQNLPADATFIGVTATSQKGHQFNGLESGYFRIVNQSGMIPLVQINLDPLEARTGVFLGLFVLNSAKAWEFVAIGDYASAKTIHEMSPSILHWAKLIGQSRGIVPTNSTLLLGSL